MKTYTCLTIERSDLTNEVSYTKYLPIALYYNNYYQFKNTTFYSTVPQYNCLNHVLELIASISAFDEINEGTS